MNQIGVERHVHINGYTVSEELEQKFLGIGFFIDPFKKLERGSTHPLLAGARFMPPHHYSFETYDLREMDYVFTAAIEAIKSGHGFEGYVESETIPPRYSYRSDYKDTWRYYIPRKDNPNYDSLPRFDLVHVPESKHKACDIHIKRYPYLRDVLDDVLLARGCYEVRTPRSRIYTLQFESVRDGMIAFNRFEDCFTRSMGDVKHMYLEVTKEMYAEPADFDFVAYVQKGSIRI